MNMKIFAILIVIALIAGTGSALAVTSIYHVQFNGSKGTTTIPISVNVSGIVTVDKSTANVGDTITVTATLNPVVVGVPIQFTLNGAVWGSSVNTDVNGVAKATYVVLSGDEGNSLNFSAQDTTYSP